jgi:NADH-quinone oxidoreductase subunit G
VAGSHDLDLLDRGFRTVIDTAPGRALDNPYSVCTADQCPVGALTETAFRFDTRVYRLSAVDSICPGCATGCHVELHTYGGQIRRTRPRYAAEVNRWWMCDDGRGLFREYAGEDRLRRALVGGREASLADGLRAAGKLLADTPAEATVLFVSAQLPTETLLAARRLAELCPGMQVYATSLPDWTGDAILRSPDRNPNTAGLKAVFGDTLGQDADLEQRLLAGKVKLALCLDGKTTHPDLVKVVSQVIVLAQRRIGILAPAEPDLLERVLALPAAAWCEQDGTFLNRNAKVGRFHAAVTPAGQAQPGWALLAGIARAADRVLPLPETAREIYASASDALGEAVLPRAAFGPSRPGVLLRFAHRRG